MFAGFRAGFKDLVASSSVTETNNLAAVNEKEIAVQFLRSVVTALKGLGAELPHAEVAEGSASVASSASSSAEHSAASVAAEHVDLAVSGIEQQVSKLGKDLEEARKGDAVTNFESLKVSCTRLMLFIKTCAALEQEITSSPTSRRLTTARREVGNKVREAKRFLQKNVTSYIDRLMSQVSNLEDMKALRQLIGTIQPVLEDSIGCSIKIPDRVLEPLFTREANGVIADVERKWGGITSEVELLEATITAFCEISSDEDMLVGKLRTFDSKKEEFLSKVRVLTANVSDEFNRLSDLILPADDRDVDGLKLKREHLVTRCQYLPTRLDELSKWMTVEHTKMKAAAEALQSQRTAAVVNESQMVTRHVSGRYVNALSLFAGGPPRTSRETAFLMARLLADIPREGKLVLCKMVGNFLAQLSASRPASLLDVLDINGFSFTPPELRAVFSRFGAALGAIPTAANQAYSEFSVLPSDRQVALLMLTMERFSGNVLGGPSLQRQGEGLLMRPDSLSPVIAGEDDATAQLGQAVAQRLPDRSIGGASPLLRNSASDLTDAALRLAREQFDARLTFVMPKAVHGLSTQVPPILRLNRDPLLEGLTVSAPGIVELAPGTVTAVPILMSDMADHYISGSHVGSGAVAQVDGEYEDDFEPLTPAETMTYSLIDLADQVKNIIDGDEAAISNALSELTRIASQLSDVDEDTDRQVLTNEISILRESIESHRIEEESLVEFSRIRDQYEEKQSEMGRQFISAKLFTEKRDILDRQEGGFRNLLSQVEAQLSAIPVYDPSHEPYSQLRSEMVAHLVSLKQYMKSLDARVALSPVNLGGLAEFREFNDALGSFSSLQEGQQIQAGLRRQLDVLISIAEGYGLDLAPNFGKEVSRLKETLESVRSILENTGDRQGDLTSKLTTLEARITQQEAKIGRAAKGRDQMAWDKAKIIATFEGVVGQFVALYSPDVLAGGVTLSQTGIPLMMETLSEVIDRAQQDIKRDMNEAALELVAQALIFYQAAAEELTSISSSDDPRPTPAMMFQNINMALGLLQRALGTRMDILGRLAARGGPTTVYNISGGVNTFGPGSHIYGASGTPSVAAPGVRVPKINSFIEILWSEGILDMVGNDLYDAARSARAASSLAAVGGTAPLLEELRTAVLAGRDAVEALIVRDDVRSFMGNVRGATLYRSNLAVYLAHQISTAPGSLEERQVICKRLYSDIEARLEAQRAAREAIKAAQDSIP